MDSKTPNPASLDSNFFEATDILRNWVGLLGAALLLTMVLSACSEGSYQVVVHLPGARERAELVEVSLVRSCGELQVPEAAPANPLRSVSVRAGEAPPPFGSIRSGLHGLHGRAWDADCVLYAAGCDAVLVADGGHGTLDVYLHEVDPRACPAESSCIDGACVEGSVSDAGPDALDDGGDAGDACAPAATSAMDSPLGLWRLDEDTGPVAEDSSGNGHDGTYVGDVVLGVDGALPATNTAADFDDSERGFIVLGDEFGFAGTATFSVEAWIRPRDATGRWRHIFTKQQRDSPKHGWALVLDPDNQVFLERYIDDGQGRGSPRGLVENAGFTHVVGTYDGTWLRLYLNGDEVGSGSLETRTMPPSTVPAVIGSGSSSVFDANFGGVLDEVAVYGQALTSEQVREHFQTSLTRSCLDAL